MDSPTTSPANDPVQDKMRAAYAKFQSRLQAIRHERLDALKGIFQRVDAKQLDEAKRNLAQE